MYASLRDGFRDGYDEGLVTGEWRPLKGQLWTWDRITSTNRVSHSKAGGGHQNRVSNSGKCLCRSYLLALEQALS